MNIQVIEKHREIKNVDAVADLISKQMMVIKGEAEYDKILTSLKKSLSKSSRARLFLIEDDAGSYAGFAFGNVCSGLESGGDYLWINEIFVDQIYRGKKLGSRLIQFIEDWCKLNDIGYIACITGLSNTKAKRLFEKNEYGLNELIWVDKELDFD